MNNKIHGNRVSPWYRSALEKHCWQWRSDADKKTQCAGRTLFSYEPNRQLDRMNRIDRRERKRLAQWRKDAERVGKRRQYAGLTLFCSFAFLIACGDSGLDDTCGRFEPGRELIGNFLKKCQSLGSTHFRGALKSLARALGYRQKSDNMRGLHCFYSVVSIVAFTVI